jgi:cyclic pyranopterin phosphate synthase
MSEKTIVLHDQRAKGLIIPEPQRVLAPGQSLTDMWHRPLRDLRISVTDRCNFRCTYCMPKEVYDNTYRYLPHADILSFEEITRLASIFLKLGVKKIRLTGGEPLLRKRVEDLVAMLSELKTLEGHAPELTLTTNATLLKHKAQALKQAGLQRVTVSLDALDETVFRRMNDVDFPVSDVLDGIAAAREAGLGLDASGHFTGLKVNMVVQRSVNYDQILPMAEHFRQWRLPLRFIEYMDVGQTNNWNLDEVVPSATIVEMISAHHSLVPLAATQAGETAKRFGYARADGQWHAGDPEVGFISSVTQAFCGDCNRSRLSTDGRLYLCLFASSGYDLRALLRGGASDVELEHALVGIWQSRDDRYSALRQVQQGHTEPGAQRVEMSYIGG